MSDWKEIDRILSEDIDNGHNDYLRGLSKYENPNEPGSLSFDAWNLGYKQAQEKYYKSCNSNK